MDKNDQLEEITEWLHDIAHVLNEIRVHLMVGGTYDAKTRLATARSLANPDIKFRRLPVD